jgi:glycerol-3-phosphate dehydrogenase
MPSIQDIVIIGGGINGAGIAADAAGRGLSVTLCERDDLASGTSSCSTKLIHGGLRYLENYEFSLVRKALREREILMKRAPHLIQPLEFVLPHEKHLRSAFLIRFGLFLYDHLTSRTLIPGSKSIDLSNDLRGQALQPGFYKGFSYYDCFTDDARLVIANALSAKEHGATILTRTEFLSAQRESSYWKILLKNTLTQGEYYIYAKALINVAGPWVKQTNKKLKPTPRSILN